MINFKLWIKAIRVPFFTATIIPVALGSIVAWYDTGAFFWVKFLLTLLAAVFVHAGTNLANDYFDHLSGCDKANPTPTPFSGGSRVIQEGLISPGAILFVAITSFILGSSLGLYLNYISAGNVIFFIGLAGVSLGFFYSIKSFRINYGSFGELAVGIGFGPLVVLGSYYIQAQKLPFEILLISIPVGILIALVVFINEFPDYIGDKAAGKRTLVVLLGKKNAIILYYILLALTYLFILSLAILKIVPAICLIVFLSLPLAFKAVSVSRINFDKVYELLPANVATIALHSAIGVLLCVGFVLAKVFSG